MLKAENDSVVKSSWLLQPLASFDAEDTDENEVGVLVGFQNENRFGSIPWQLDARVLRQQDVRGEAHGKWQLDAELDPKAPTIGVPLLAVLTAAHVQTLSVERTEEIGAEVDVALKPDSTLTLGAAAVYDWTTAKDGVTSQASTFAIIGYYQYDRFKLIPEYDIKHGNEEESYNVSLTVNLLESPRGNVVGLRAGWAKGNALSVRLEWGVANNRHLPPSRR